MTGTGDSNNPWVPANWQEFKQIMNWSREYTNMIYVSLPPNTIYDLNKEEPDGLSSSLIMNYLNIRGNNSKIINMHFVDDVSYLYITDCNIYDLDFVNMYHIMMGNNSKTPIIYVRHINQITSFHNCRFSGYCSKRPLLGIGSTGENQVNFYGCSMNVKLPTTDSGLFTSMINNNACRVSVKYSHINTIGEGFVGTYNTPYNFNLPVTLTNSKMTGSGSLCSISNSSAYSIIDMNLTKFDCNTTANGISVVNSDTTKQYPPTDVPNVYRKATTEQLKSEEYLNSINFPLGVDS